MNIMNKLTLKHIKKNKAKTVVTIIGIIISVAMLTAVTTGMTSGLRWLRDCEIGEYGKWHAKFSQLSIEQYQKLQGMDKMEEVFATKDLGYAAADHLKSLQKPYVYVRAFDSEALQNMAVHVTAGRLPKNESELIISKPLSEAGETALKLGDTVTYQLGERYVKSTTDEAILNQNGMYYDVPLTQNNSYQNGKNPIHALDQTDASTAVVSEELRTSGETKTYTIVGVMDRPNYTQEPPSAAGYSAYTVLDVAALAATDHVDGYCYYSKVSKGIYSEMEETAKQLGVERPSEINDNILYYEGVSPDSGFNMFLRGMYVILIAIIMVGSVSLIYNSFAISISERSRQLGMLASVGATKWQKRNSVFFEAAVYGGIGIPVGVLAGIGGMSVAFYVVSGMLTNSFEVHVPLRIVVTPGNLAMSIIVSVLTIFISAYLPARKASKISAIEAIRQSKDITINVKKVRTSWITRKLFGFEGELALKNMKRNRKRYRSIIFALFISVILFISVSAYLQYVTSAYYMTNETSNYDLSLYLYGENGKALGKEEVDRNQNIVNEIASLEQVDDVTKTMGMSLLLDQKQLSSYFSEEMKENMEVGSDGSDESSAYTPYASIYALDDDSFDAYCKKAGIDPKEVRASKNGMILINVIETRNDYTIKRFSPLKVSKKQVITVRNDEAQKEENREAELTIAATTSELPIGRTEYPSSCYSDFILVAAESTFQSVYDSLLKGAENAGAYSSVVYINTKQDEAVEKQLVTILTENKVAQERYHINNIAAGDRSNRQLVYAVSIFAYGFIILMSLICCANMCNTVSTSIALRRTEFAMLKSVGMTPKRFQKMIRFESLLYGVKALVYGIPVSLAISYVLYRCVDTRFTVSFLLPWYIYAIAAALVFGVVGIAMSYSSTKIRNENIIDGLKKDFY